MKRQPTPKDVPADNPVGTLARFNDGLRKVLRPSRKRSHVKSRPKPRQKGSVA